MNIRRIMIITLTAAFVLSGCATVKGVGRDIHSVGQAGEKVINGR